MIENAKSTEGFTLCPLPAQRLETRVKAAKLARIGTVTW